MYLFPSFSHYSTRATRIIFAGTLTIEDPTWKYTTKFLVSFWISLGRVVRRFIGRCSWISFSGKGEIEGKERCEVRQGPLQKWNAPWRFCKEVVPSMKRWTACITFLQQHLLWIQMIFTSVSGGYSRRRHPLKSVPPEQTRISMMVCLQNQGHVLNIGAG